MVVKKLTLQSYMILYLVLGNNNSPLIQNIATSPCTSALENLESLNVNYVFHVPPKKQIVCCKGEQILRMKTKYEWRPLCKTQQRVNIHEPPFLDNV